MSPYWAGFDEYALWQVTPGNQDNTGRDTRFSKPMIRTNGQRCRYLSDDYGPDVVSDYGLDFMEKAVEDKNPFLLYYPMILTHCPFSPTPDSENWLTDDTTVMTYKGNADYFEDMVAYTDDIVGRFYSKIHELGIEDNTILIFTGDNGTDVPVVSKFNGIEVAGAKGKTTDAGTKVPLIIYAKDQIIHGVNSNLIDLTDIMPTICQAAEIEIPSSPNIDGISFWPQLVGEKSNPRAWIYCWYSRNGIDSLAQVFARDHKYKLYADGEFYSLTDDPLEADPLSQGELSKEQINVRIKLKGVIDQYANRRLELVN